MHSARKSALFLIFYTVFWSSWFVFTQTIGRASLGFFAVLAYDLALVATLFFITKNLRLEKSSLLADLRLWWRTNPVLFSVSALLLASTLFTCVFQVPFDWDGTDYHLPPMIESFKAGHWLRSENPYFAAQSYPKASGSLYLWWVLHFGSLFGQRLLLLVPLLHFAAGIAVIRLLFPKSKWTLLFFISLPLVIRQACSSYADLPALVSLLTFLYFALHAEKKRGYLALAALAIGVHGALKYISIATGMGAIAALFGYWLISKQLTKKTIKPKLVLLTLCAFSFGLFASTQLIENYRITKNPVHPFACKVLGKNFCSGTIDPASLVVEPVLDFPADMPWVLKVAKGWLPTSRELIAGTEPYHGGFGLAWVLPLLLLFMFFNARRNPVVNSNALPVLIVVFISDFMVSGLWYTRFHLGLGFCLCTVAALALEAFEKNQKTLAQRAVFKACVLFLALQMMWLIPQRNWFLGSKSARDLPDVAAQNLKHIIAFGSPKLASNPADQRSIALLKNSHKHIVICGDKLRPVLAAYGRTLTNTVEWHDLAHCLKGHGKPFETIQDTRYWIYP